MQNHGWQTHHLTQHILYLVKIFLEKTERLAEEVGYWCMSKTTLTARKLNCIAMECMAVRIILSTNMSFTVICLSRPPSSNGKFYEYLRNTLKEFDINNELILLGDFNINWMEKSKRKKLRHYKPIWFYTINTRPHQNHPIISNTDRSNI